MTSTAAHVSQRRRIVAVVAALIATAATLLVVAVLIERPAETGQIPPPAATSEQQEGHHYGESSEGTHRDSTPSAVRDGEAVERATGINLEAPWIVALGTFASIGCAVALWRRPTRPVIAAVAAFTTAAVILDALEVGHQIGEDRIALAILAGMIAAVRVAAIAGSAYLYRTAPTAP